MTALGVRGREERVVPVAECVLEASADEWGFAREQATAIEAHWSARKAVDPLLFNGVVHLLIRWEIIGGTLRGTFLRTDFKSYLYWRDNGYPDASPRDCFGAALIRSREGHVLLGRQRPGNINGGLAYPPGGFIDRRDVGDGVIDIDASIQREIQEETGLGAGDLARAPGYRVVFAGPLVAIAAEYRSHLPADVLRRRVLDHLTADSDSELTDALVVRAVEDLEPATPPYARLLLGTVLPGGVAT